MAGVLDRQAVDRTSVFVLKVPIKSATILADDVVVPDAIVDFATFREWSRADGFPDRGRIDYFSGRIWVDLGMEQAYIHNSVKKAFVICLECFEEIGLGRLFTDGMRLVNADAELSTEPDGSFLLYESLNSGKIREIPGKIEGCVEFEGSPDLMFEVVSASSTEKDFTELPDPYHRAGVGEFWRVDARLGETRFELLRWSEQGYLPAEERDGWQHSLLFDKWFQLLRELDRRGNPRCRFSAR